MRQMHPSRWCAARAGCALRPSKNSPGLRNPRSVRRRKQGTDSVACRSAMRVVLKFPDMTTSRPPSPHLVRKTPHGSARSTLPSPAQRLSHMKTRRRVPILGDHPDEPDPVHFVFRHRSLYRQLEAGGVHCRVHLPKIPRSAARDRAVSRGSPFPDASRISSIQSSSLRVTTVPKIFSTALKVVSFPLC